MIRILFIALMTAVLVMATDSQVLAKEITVRGKLQKTVEANGWLIVAETQKYLILNPQRFLQEKWFREATQVEATGETKDVMTIYMEGLPFEVRSMRPLSQAESERSASEERGFARVMVTGDSIVQTEPDTATITVSVVTQNKLALEAQQENAGKTAAVIRALKATTPEAEIKTSGYTLQAQRTYRENQPPTITGYEARNSVVVTLSDLSKAGAVIDAAAQAGANDVAGIAFTLRKDRVARDQALHQATREAMSKANIIAAALGGRLLHIVEVQEEGVIRPRPIEGYDVGVAGTSVRASTPIEVGTLEITSRVQLIAEVQSPK
jgi:uncharacterized protein YggE